MKKTVLTLVAMMTLSFGYAETKSNNAEMFDRAEAAGFWTENSAEDYDMSFDMRRLAEKLDLTAEQMNVIEVIQDCFNSEMQSVASEKRHMRRFLVHQAVRKDLHQMRQVLNAKQFNTYMMLLGTTLRNKGL